MSEYGEELRDWPPDGDPIVFRFPPAEYEVIAPDRFHEWEQRLIEFTGLKVLGGRDGQMALLPTISWCGPGETDPCDCDRV